VFVCRFLEARCVEVEHLAALETAASCPADRSPVEAAPTMRRTSISAAFVLSMASRQSEQGAGGRGREERDQQHSYAMALEEAIRRHDSIQAADIGRAVTLMKP
jgi:hypothetical protein